jgi:hypothetical protein
MTTEEAIAKAKTGWWKDKTPKEIVDFQLYEEKLCMDFSDFHKAVEKVLHRPVWTHEFADVAGLRAEYEGKRAPESNPIESLIRIREQTGG